MSAFKEGDIIANRHRLKFRLLYINNEMFTIVNCSFRGAVPFNEPIELLKTYEIVAERDRTGGCR